MAEKIELNSVDKFDPHSDPTHLAQSWERWLMYAVDCILILAVHILE